ncbi:MAG: 5'/3'-nucleotidase SurE [Gammaproteobacteria bacterium]|nr:5'/3'-nucleotidase SurE [Gammaproteobacteria bacterium]
MRILVSNDDGYRSAGIRALAAALDQFGEVIIVAPEINRSGASNSLTLDSPLRMVEAEQGVFFVNGTPTDCVHLAITGLMDPDPDMVVSGINDGANLGDDVLYSGTVAAAMEGRCLGLPAIAFSLVTAGEPRHLDTAARIAREIVTRLVEHPLPTDTILNVNIPDLPYENLQGIEVTRLGNRHRAEPVIRGRDPRGREIYWVGSAGSEQDAGSGTDFFAISKGCVSVTPLLVDLTRHPQMNVVREWLAQ